VLGREKKKTLLSVSTGESNPRELGGKDKKERGCYTNDTSTRKRGLGEDGEGQSKSLFSNEFRGGMLELRKKLTILAQCGVKRRGGKRNTHGKKRAINGEGGEEGEGRRRRN